MHSLNFEVNHDSLSIKSDGEFETQDGYIAEDPVLPSNMMIPLRETHICEENHDSFGDFHMSLPQPIPAEPLKPVVVHSIATTSSSTTVQIPAKIEWPEPGLTEDDIHTIELTYVKQPKKTTTAIEDDDWTDFISHKETKQNDLQLSVFNLGNVQPIKPPVPVLTPQGLIQTRLSSSTTTTSSSSSPLFGSPKKQLTASKPIDGYQPSIISQQFSMGNSMFVPNTTTRTQQQHNDDDDDDWTDFVSSQPVQQQQSFQDFRLNGDLLKQTTKNSVPSVLLPDLDFVIGKNHRTFPKK